MLTAEQIASATGAPLRTVQENWPVILRELTAAGLTSRAAIVCTAATVAVETGTFVPVEEKASGEAYEGRSVLGNRFAGDGPRFKGRGYVQITGRWNYDHFGRRVGVDLIADPKKACDPDVAAKVLVAYMKERGVIRAAEAGDWRRSRQLVNGGANGMDTYLKFAGALWKLSDPS